MVTSAPSAWTASTVQLLTDSPFEVHGAGAAVGRVATDVGAGQPEHVAQVVDEQEPRLDLGLVRLTVDGDLTARTGVLIQSSPVDWLSRT